MEMLKELCVCTHLCVYAEKISELDTLDSKLWMGLGVCFFTIAVLIWGLKTTPVYYFMVSVDQESGQAY